MSYIAGEQIARRSFVRAMGGTAVLPFLDAMVPGGLGAIMTRQSRSGPYDHVSVQGHMDNYELGGRLANGETAPLRDFMLPRFLEGGMDVIVMPIGGTVLNGRGGNQHMLQGTLQWLEVILGEIEKAGDKAGIIRSRADLPSAPDRNKVWFFLDMEGAEPIQVNPESELGRDQRLALLRHFYRLGVRGIQLTHHERNYLADAHTMEPRAGGLTPAGIEIIEEMNRLGMMVGVAHMAGSSLLHAAEVSTAPIVSTHTNINPFVDTTRQHRDPEIRAIAATGGFIAVRYIVTRRPHTPYPLLVDEIDYMSDLVGVEHVGIGMLGYDKGHPSGGSGPRSTEVEQMTIYEQWDSFMQLLSARGYSDDQIGLIVGGNFLRVWNRILK